MSLLIGLLICLMDSIHWMQINVDEFTDLCNAIALRFQKEDTVSQIVSIYTWKLLISCNFIMNNKELLSCTMTMCVLVAAILV